MFFIVFGNFLTKFPKQGSVDSNAAWKILKSTYLLYLTGVSRPDLPISWSLCPEETFFTLLAQPCIGHTESKNKNIQSSSIPIRHPKFYQVYLVICGCNPLLQGSFSCFLSTSV